MSSIAPWLLYCHYGYLALSLIVSANLPICLSIYPSITYLFIWFFCLLFFCASCESYNLIVVGFFLTMNLFFKMQYDINISPGIKHSYSVITIIAEFHGNI